MRPTRRTNPSRRPVATPLKLPVSMRTARKGASPEFRDAQEGSSDNPLGRSLHPASEEKLRPGNGTVVRSGRGRQSRLPGMLPPIDATAVPERGQGGTRRRPGREIRQVVATGLFRFGLPAIYEGKSETQSRATRRPGLPRASAVGSLKGGSGRRPRGPFPYLGSWNGGQSRSELRTPTGNLIIHPAGRGPRDGRRFDPSAVWRRSILSPDGPSSPSRELIGCTGQPPAALGEVTQHWSYREGAGRPFSARADDEDRARADDCGRLARARADAYAGSRRAARGVRAHDARRRADARACGQWPRADVRARAAP
jgi:hypothetical protein